MNNNKNKMAVPMTRCLYVSHLLSTSCIVAHFVDRGVHKGPVNIRLSRRDNEWTSWSSNSDDTAFEVILSKYNTISRDGLEYALREEGSIRQELGKLNRRHQHDSQSAPHPSGFSFSDSNKLQ